MSLDAHRSKLTKYGTVTVYPEPQGRAGIRIVVEGFEGENCTCRDVAVQACLWAIGELQRQVMRDVQAPGGGAVGVD